MEHLLLVHDPHIVAITETWLHPSIISSEIVPPGYEMLRKDRLTRGGGVALLIKSGLTYSKLEDQENAEAVWCKIGFDGSYYLVGAFYRPPNLSNDIIEETKTYLMKHYKNDGRLIIAGDFNLPTIDWNALSPGTSETKQAQQLLDVAFAFDLTQIVRSYTREQGGSKPILDLIFLGHKLVGKYDLETVDGISDHKMLILSLEVGIINCAGSRRTKVRDFTRSDDIGIIDLLDLSYGEFEPLQTSQPYLLSNCEFF